MSSPFQRSPSGDVFGGDPTGTAIAGSSVVPVYNPDTGEYEPQTLPAGGGGSGVPLSAVFYVDGNTIVPLADQDGSIGAPYADPQDAIDAHGASGCTLYLVPRFGYSDITIPENARVELIGMGGGSGGDPSMVSLGAIDVSDGATVELTSIDCGAVTLGAASGLKAYGGFAIGSVSGATGTLELHGITIQRSSQSAVGLVSVASVEAEGVLFTDDVTTTGDAVLQTSLAGGGIIVAVGGDLYWDLMSATAFRSVTVNVTGTTNILDAPTKRFNFNVDDVSFAPGVLYQTVAFTGARVGDTFSIAIRDQLGGVNLALGQPMCPASDQVDIPIIALSGATTASMDVTVTRFSVKGAE